MHFHYYLPLERSGVLHFNESKSFYPENALSQGWLKLAQWFWRKRFLNFVNIFSLFCYYLPLEKGMVLHLKNLNPLHPRMLCAKFGWNWPSGRKCKKFMIKKEKLWSEVLTWPFGSGEVKKKSNIISSCKICFFCLINYNSQTTSINKMREKR